MNKTVCMIALVAFLSLGLVASHSYAAGRMGKGSFMTFDSHDLIGASVQDSHGEFLGVVNEVMIGSGGHAFAIVNHGDYDLYGEGGVNSPVPFEALRILQTKSGNEKVVFKMDAEHFDFAPYLDPTKPINREREGEIYLYYGIQPYWTWSSTAGRRGLREFNSLNLVGAAVKDSCGKVIGIVNEVLVDSNGRAFAVINHGDSDLYGESGVNTPVPFKELRIRQGKAGEDTVTLKTDMEHLDFAPYLDPTRPIDRQREANIFLYYGIQPNWTRSSALSK